MAAAKLSALPPHSFLLYAAFILSIFPVQLFFINRSRGKESKVISFDVFSTSPSMITSARFPVISPLVNAISGDLSSDPQRSACTAHLRASGGPSSFAALLRRADE